MTPAEEPGPSDSLIDPVWEAVVELLLPLGPVTERRSRYGDKPALVVAGQREIAHYEAPGVVDVRITRRGWRRFGPIYDGDRRAQRRGRSDWIQLHLTVDDVEAMSDLLSARTCEPQLIAWGLPSELAAAGRVVGDGSNLDG